jgi:alpha-beta hydrolase superfamily lysophospholipase
MQHRGRRFGLAAALVLSLTLGACAPPNFRESPTAARALGPGEIPYAGLVERHLITDDGEALDLQTWTPTDPQGRPVRPTAAIVALHGFDDYAEEFADPGTYLAEHGIATFAYDQRGFGHSAHSGRWPGTDTLKRDLRTAIRLVRAQLPGVPVYALGCSMGGAVVLATLADGGPDLPDGAILAPPAVWARETMPIANRVVLWAGARIIPDMSFTGRGLGVLASDNIPMLRALGRDPLYIHATRTDTIYGLVDLMDQGLAAAPKVTAPLLVLYGAKDQVIPKEPIADLMARLPLTADGTQRLAYYADGWHLILRDLERRTVDADLVAWIADHHAALPSGADKAAAHFPPAP